jgi:hypothetical protein
MSIRLRKRPGGAKFQLCAARDTLELLRPSASVPVKSNSRARQALRGPPQIRALRRAIAEPAKFRNFPNLAPSCQQHQHLHSRNSQHHTTTGALYAGHPHQESLCSPIIIVSTPRAIIAVAVLLAAVLALCLALKRRAALPAQHGLRELK